MKLRKKILSFVLAVAVVGTTMFTQAEFVSAAQTDDVITADVTANNEAETIEAVGDTAFEDGVYYATSTSANRMFKPEKTVVTIVDGVATAKITMPGTTWRKYYYGTIDEATAAGSAAWIEPEVVDEKNVYTIPVTGYDTPIPVACQNSKEEFRNVSITISSASMLKEGAYEVDATSLINAAMFKVDKATLKVADGGMTADITMSGTGYDKLYMGTATEAAAADESTYITYTVGSDGKYMFTIPVSALNTEIAIAAYGTKGGKWYDRALMFKLPEEECTHSYTETVSPATMTTAGSVVKKCNDCGVQETVRTIAAASNVNLANTTYVYNGKTRKPVVQITDSTGATINSENYTVTYSTGSKAVGTYQATITFKGDYTGTKTLTYKINPKSTSITKLTKAKKAFTVKIKKNTAQTTGYQVQYSTNKNFKKSATKTKTVKSSKTTNVKINKLKANKKYYVRVRTYKKSGSKTYYSTWSKTKTVVTRK